MQIFSYLCSAKEIAKVNPADGQRSGTMVVQVCNRGCGTLSYVLLADKCSGQTARAYWIQNKFLCFYFRDNIWAIRAASARAGLPVAVKGNWSTEST